MLEKGLFPKSFDFYLHQKKYCYKYKRKNSKLFKKLMIFIPKFKQVLKIYSYINKVWLENVFW